MDSKNCRKLGIFYKILTENFLLLKELDFRDRTARLQALAAKAMAGEMIRL